MWKVIAIIRIANQISWKLKVASVPLFNPDFVLLSSKLDKFKAKNNHHTFTVQSEKSDLVSFASLTLICLEFFDIK